MLFRSGYKTWLAYIDCISEVCKIIRVMDLIADLEISLTQIARELRLRDIGGIIVVDFIDMTDDCKISSLILVELSVI